MYKGIWFAIVTICLLSPGRICFAQEQSLVNYQPLAPISSDSQKGWEPLSQDEIAEKKLQLMFGAVGAVIELFDSLHLPYLHEKASDAVEAGKKIDSYRKWLKKKYGIKIKAKEEELFLLYSRSF
jgi:hypothetical protein